VVSSQHPSSTTNVLCCSNQLSRAIYLHCKLWYNLHRQNCSLSRTPLSPSRRLQSMSLLVHLSYEVWAACSCWLCCRKLWCNRSPSALQQVPCSMVLLTPMPQGKSMCSQMLLFLAALKPTRPVKLRCSNLSLSSAPQCSSPSLPSDCHALPYLFFRLTGPFTSHPAGAMTLQMQWNSRSRALQPG